MVLNVLNTFIIIIIPNIIIIKINRIQCCVLMFHRRITIRIIRCVLPNSVNSDRYYFEKIGKCIQTLTGWKGTYTLQVWSIESHITYTPQQKQAFVILCYLYSSDCCYGWESLLLYINQHDGFNLCMRKNRRKYMSSICIRKFAGPPLFHLSNLGKNIVHVRILQILFC